ncbi:MAG: ATP-dependent zinc metalloprotease FtsH [Phycisphaerae bacterium]
MNDKKPNPDKPNRPMPPQMPNKFGRPLMGWVLIIGLALVLVMLWNQGFGNRQKLTASEFWTYAHNTRSTGDLVGTVIVREREIEGTLREDLPGIKPDQPRKFYVPYEYKNHEGFQTELSKAVGNRVKIDYEPTSWWSGFLPPLLVTAGVIFLLWFFLLRKIGAAGGGGAFSNFGRSRHRTLNKEHVKVTFDDVAGIQEAKEEVSELIEFLRNPKRFSRIGGRVPRGVLLAGEPGCGKTLLAKAIAGEAEVPFFSISGSDFVEMFVGVGASRVRDLFRQAKESAPCIIFLDEIDAVGRKRTHDAPGGSQETSQTLNAILVEMDGFDSSDQVIVIAATNRPDVLDPALTRPGRFDRQIRVPLPDLKGRLDILRIYLEKVRTGPDVEPERLARGTAMFSGADLEAIVNEAAIAATMAGKDFIEQADLEEARDKVRWGRTKKSRVIDEQEKEATAYHEAGHAVVQLLTKYSDPLHKVSIIPRGPMGGATFSLPEKDRYFYSRNYCTDLMKVCYAGRIAEQLFDKDINSGAQNDIAKATEIARKMVLDWGMSDQLGPVNYANDDQHIMSMDMGGKNYSEVTAQTVDSEIRRFIEEAYTASREILSGHREAVQRVAEALLKYETLTAEDVEAIVAGKKLDKPTVRDLLDAEHAQLPEHNTGKDVSPDHPPAEPGLGPAPQPG